MQELSIKGFRLSPQQKRLWLLQLSTSPQNYRVHCTVRIQGSLNLKILELAIQKVVERNEILRTNFQTLMGMTIPLQVINQNSLLVICHHDLSKLSTEEQNSKLETLFQTVTHHSFDLERGSVLEISLVILSSKKYILLIGLPAMNADAVTLNNLVDEINCTYTTYLQNQNLQNREITEAPLQYADLAEWQNELFEGEEAKLGKGYWCKQYFPDFTNWQLPYENSAPEPEFEPRIFSLASHIKPERLEAIAQKYNTKIPVILQACWQILLWRITGRSEFVIGTYCDGRNYQELESALGLFAKYLPINCNLEAGLKFSEVLGQTSREVDNSFKWQESFSWDYITSSTEGDRNFFPFCFEFEKQQSRHYTSDLSFSIEEQFVCIDRFKIKLVCWHRDEISMALHYDASLFQLEDISHLAKQFQTLLESAINQPEVAIGELEILPDSDRQQLLVEFNNTSADYPKHQCWHQLFEQQAALTPNSIAVVCEDRQLTYAQLNARANQLAHHLQSLGVASETIVALYLDRSVEICVGMLGVLKAGAAYLPLDPQLPADRLTFMVQDAKASVILTQQHLAQLTPQIATICFDTDWQAIAQQPDVNPCSQVTPTNLAYIIYTSGSSGNPKGVAIEHQQLLNYLHGILKKLDLPLGSSFATVSTFAADLGNTAIFPALCTGGCLHIIAQERATNAETLADYCDRHPIDCLKIVPSHLNALLSATHPAKILPRQRLILGGEALSWNLVEKIQQYAPNCQIFNHYGPTETTVGVLTYAIQNGAIQDEVVTATVPLGRPIANTQAYILDDRLQPLPIGIPGELYIGGDSVARGYLNRPELTAERFIPNPFVGEREHGTGDREQGAEGEASRLSPFASRLYKTGDLARYLPDGNIEFLGRRDRQVKMHGFRIELAEIESALAQHPAIRAAVVLAREDEPDKKRLVAYVVLHQQLDSVTDLRHFLKQQLPEYAIPTAFVQLKALPLTPNGKIDWQALPAPDNTRSELSGQFVAPRTQTEKIIAGIWSEVLELEKVGIYDNFFEIGGDSILSIQIATRINQSGLQVTPKQLFEQPTVAGLAAVVGTVATQAEQGTVTGLVPLTPIQDWFFEQELPDPHHWNQALLLEVQQAIAPALLEQAVQNLLMYHDALRLQFTPTESGWQQINAGLNATDVPFSRLDLSGLSAEEQAVALSATTAELQASLNFTQGSLLRVAWFDLGGDRPNLLLFIIHHLAVDGVSWRILLSDLQTIYQQLSQGQSIQLPAKTTSFKQWSEFLQEYARSTTLQQERDYWLYRFAGTTAEKIPPTPLGKGGSQIPPTPLEKGGSQLSLLPLDNPDGTNTVATANSVLVALNGAETRALLQEVPAAYRTQIDDVLLTALVQTFNQWTQGNSLLVDLEGHGREAIAPHLDLSRTVGWFTTIFPVLLTLDGISQPGEALKAVKEQLRNVPQRGIGYGVLRYLSQDTSTRTQLEIPQAQVRFNYLGQFDQVLPESSLFKLVDRQPEASRSPQGNRHYLLDVSGLVLGGQLQLEWTYSDRIHQRTTIERLANKYIETLRSLIAHCQSAAGDYTPSDFPQANLSQTDLEQFLAKIKPRE